MCVIDLLFIQWARELRLIKMDALQSQGFASQLVRGGHKWGMSSLTKRAEAKAQQEEPVSSRTKTKNGMRNWRDVVVRLQYEAFVSLKIQSESTSNESRNGVCCEEKKD